jgi:tartrate/fumarate subfamily iron-sulfur-dependent hydro-lyase alpha chain
MIKLDAIEDWTDITIQKSACCIPPDVHSALEKAAKTEKSPISKLALQNTLASLNRSIEIKVPACGDTGWPLFFCKIGSDVHIEGGLVEFERVCKKSVEKATAKGILRKTMKHPLTGFDPGNNIGNNIPSFRYKYVRGDFIQVTFVPKGGGGELFGGSQYAVIALGDGIAGIEKFVIDSYIGGTRAGAICPPSILGVGIGGTFEICAQLAKEAAVLRVVGSQHPDPQISQIEEDLIAAISELKIGAMGLGGDISVLDVNVEYSHTHIAGITVAVNTSCLITRRATTRIYQDGRIEELDNPQWFDGR